MAEKRLDGRGLLKLPLHTEVFSVASSPLLLSWRRQLRAANKRDKTISGYLESALTFLRYARSRGWPDPEYITRAQILEWVEHLRLTVKPYSMRHYFVEARLFFTWLVKEGERKDNPFAGLEIPQVDEAPKDIVAARALKEILSQLDAAKRWRDSALIALLYDTGMRAGEIANARVELLDLDGGSLFIPLTKTHLSRTAWLSRDLCDRLDRYHRHRRRERQPGQEFVIAGERGQFSRWGVTRAVTRIFNEHGIPHISPHDLRHTSASHAALSGMPAAQLDSQYGWRPGSKMSHRYTESVQADLARKAHLEHSPLKKLGER